MTKTYTVKFLVNEEQLNRLKHNASAKGYKTLSSYLRDLALNKDIVFEKMLIEIHNEVMKNERTKSECGST